jgi:hypothetical protein
VPPSAAECHLVGAVCSFHHTLSLAALPRNDYSVSNVCGGPWILQLAMCSVSFCARNAPVTVVSLGVLIRRWIRSVRAEHMIHDTNAYAVDGSSIANIPLIVEM